MPSRDYKKKKSRSVFGKRGRIYGKAGYQLAKDVMYLKSVINSELHYYVHTISSLSVSSTGGIVHLTPIGVGDTAILRTGDSILPKYLNVKFNIHNANAGQRDTCRVIFFMWKEMTTPSITDILHSASPYAHYAVNSTGVRRDRLINVLYDKTFTVVNGTAKENVSAKCDLQMNRPGVKQPVHIKYAGTGTTNEMNGIYMAVIGLEPTNYSLMNGEAKFQYYDN